MDYNSPRFSTIWFHDFFWLCRYKLNMDRMNMSPLCFNETWTKPEIFRLQVPGVSFLVVQIRNHVVRCRTPSESCGLTWKTGGLGFFFADGRVGCTFWDASFKIHVFFLHFEVFLDFRRTLFSKSLFVWSKARLENLMTKCTKGWSLFEKFIQKASSNI